MIKYIVCAVLIVVWLYTLHAMDRAELHFWRYLVGSIGLFVFMMVVIRPVMVEPMARAVAAISGLFGSLTNTFAAFFRYGILFIQAEGGAITLQIDFECSGIIEIMAYLALLTFFRVYSPSERVIMGIIGTLYIIIANVLRVTVICELIHFIGPEVYYLAHSLVGRVIFYALSVLLYFYVFTKSHIIRMQLKKFSYEHS